MSEIKESAENVLDTIEDILETHRDIAVVKFLQRFSTTASAAVIGIIGLLMILLILVFAGIGLAMWIGESLQNMKAGFFIVGGLFIVALSVILLIAKRVLVPIIRNLIIDKIYEED